MFPRVSFSKEEKPSKYTFVFPHSLSDCQQRKAERSDSFCPEWLNDSNMLAIQDKDPHFLRFSILPSVPKCSLITIILIYLLWLSFFPINVTEILVSLISWLTECNKKTVLSNGLSWRGLDFYLGGRYFYYTLSSLRRRHKTRKELKKQGDGINS